MEIFVNCSNPSAPLIAPPSQAPQTTFMLFILAIGVAIATIFGEVFELESRESGGFNAYFNVLNNDFKLELECDFCDVLSPIDTINATVDTPAPGFNLQ